MVIMAIMSNNQLVEIRRLAVLLLEVINIAEGCITKLRRGFIEPIDADDVRIRIKKIQIQILQIDNLADEVLNGQEKKD